MIFLYSRLFVYEQEMPNVKRKYQNHVIKCEAQNAVGLSADSETLDVICEY